MGIRTVTEPTVEPITLANLRLHLGIEPYEVDSSGNGDHPHDAMIMAMLTAARSHAEEFTGRSIALKTYEATFDAFPDGDAELELPHPPLVSIEAVRYVDAAGDLQTLATDRYTSDRTDPTAGWLLCEASSTWPGAATVANAVRVEYRAGYQVPEPDSSAEDADTLPGSIRAALLLMVGHLYENREAVANRQVLELPLGVETLLRPYRVRLGMA
jgi:uncharacterized phiE125 gp8 family phage protein